MKLNVNETIYKRRLLISTIARRSPRPYYKIETICNTELATSPRRSSAYDTLSRISTAHTNRLVMSLFAHSQIYLLALKAPQIPKVYGKFHYRCINVFNNKADDVGDANVDTRRCVNIYLPFSLYADYFYVGFDVVIARGKVLAILVCNRS